MAEWTVTKLGRTLGAEVQGCDLNQMVDDPASVEWIKQTLAENPVLIFRKQSLNAEQVGRLGKALGKVEPHLIGKYRHPDIAEVSYVTNVGADGGVDQQGVDRATNWHTDEPYKQAPPRLAILHALEVPKVKGGTMFADMRAAYDDLPDTMKQQLDGLVALHRGNNVRLEGGETPEARHPVVMVHPLSNRPLLFVHPNHTKGIDGMRPEEAGNLIQELAGHAIKDQYVYYHNWHVGDVLMWDEMSTMHRNAGDSDPNEHRVFLRTIVH